MIRVVFFLVIVGAAALGAAWLADRPGEVVITWQGWRIETSLMVLCAAMLAAMAVIALLWTVVRAVLFSPFHLRRHWHHRRGERAYEAISRGLVAVGTGDLGGARKASAEVERLAPKEPLALLLRAQAAQLAGDRGAADAVFRAMASRAETKALGLHGLFIEARRRADHAGAQAFAEEAARVSPSLSWAAKAVLEFRCATGDWAGALALLETNKAALDKERYRRQRAVMLTARALSVQESDRENAKALALEAARLSPPLVPAAALAGRMLAEGGELRKAARLVSKAWRANPHPELAEVFSNLRFGDAARDRLKRIETLARSAPGHIEGALALARAAIDARQFGKARAALASYLTAPTKRVALLMAELERAESNDEGRAREWIARAVNAAPDSAWTADGHVSDRWLPVSPSGRLDGFEWRVPLTALASAPRSIEPEPMAVPGASEQKGDDSPAAGEAVSAPAEPATTAPPPIRTEAVQGKSDPVIPLIHAPDDPGPEPSEEREPRAAPGEGGWRRIL